MSIKDYGIGNPQMFSPDELERWFQQPTVDHRTYIVGRELNERLGVTTYEADMIYVVTPEGIQTMTLG